MCLLAVTNSHSIVTIQIPLIYLASAPDLKITRTFSIRPKTRLLPPTTPTKVLAPLHPGPHRERLGGEWRRFRAPRFHEPGRGPPLVVLDQGDGDRGGGGSGGYGELCLAVTLWGIITIKVIHQAR